VTILKGIAEIQVFPTEKGKSNEKVSKSDYLRDLTFPAHNIQHVTDLN
jgi:hypothetical protein